MMLWFILALMTAVAIVAVLWPLARRTPLRTGSDVAVYRDQLDEIERDRAAGLIGESEAEAARVEVSRRLLAAADAVTAAPKGDAVRRRRLASLAALILLPLGAAGLYLQLGSPDLERQTQAAQRETPAEPRPMVEMVGRVEEHLAKNPEDGRGWEVLGAVYMQLGRYGEAAKARRNALRLLGPTAERESDLGEALTGAQNGIVTAEAKEAFDRAARLDSREVRARYFIGLAAEQDGRPQEAATMWRALLAEAPADASWTGFVRESLMRVDPSGAAPQQRGPSAEDIAAANQMSPEQRNEMVRGMVSRLAERLKQDGSDVEGWQRLLRAYKVLGDAEQARAAAGDARRALAGDPDKLRRLEEFIAHEAAASAAPAAGAAPPPAPSAAPASPPGPSAADIAAASEMSPEQQETMIRGMVARLAGRLQQDGSDVEGWLRLLRAYMVLGDRDLARAAAGDARRALASDPDKLRRVDDLIKGLGLEG